MNSDTPTHSTFEEYVSSFPESTQSKLIELRKIILDLLPETTEKISYGMPTFVFKGNRLYFAGYAKHIGFYPGTAAIEAFKIELESYKTSKGTVQFPLNKPFPIDLIKRMVKFRMTENLKSEK